MHIVVYCLLLLFPQIFIETQFRCVNIKVSAGRPKDTVSEGMQPAGLCDTINSMITCLSRRILCFANRNEACCMG